MGKLSDLCIFYLCTHFQEHYHYIYQEVGVITHVHSTLQGNIQSGNNINLKRKMKLQILRVQLYSLWSITLIITV
jgi:hypothetical protein